MADENKASGVVAAPSAPAPASTSTSTQAPGVKTVAPATAKPQDERVYGVELAGVPETPLSTATASAAGPAIPSTDNYETLSSPNKETSSDAPLPKFLGGDA